MNKRRTAIEKELTAAQVCVRAARRGIDLNPNILALRRSQGKDAHIKRGPWVRYTEEQADALIDHFAPRLIVPSEHREAS